MATSAVPATGVKLAQEEEMTALQRAGLNLESTPHEFFEVFANKMSKTGMHDE